MNAHDRFLPEWFNRVRSRQITLPRFQRSEAWGYKQVEGLLTTVLRGLPSGATLILEVGDEEKFPSRTMADAPESGQKVSEQLLDGQQRLTALWRSLNDKYPNRTYMIRFPADTGEIPGKLLEVYGEARSVENGRRYPVWVDDPKACWRKRLIPISLLRPEDMDVEIDQWVENAIAGNEANEFQAYKALKNIINDLRIKVREFNLPYLALPAQTPKEVALDVFIKMNTSSMKLSAYDIVVALMENLTGQSLRDRVDALKGEVKRASEYKELSSLVLDVVALRQNIIPGETGYRRINHFQMLSDWDAVVDGIEGMVGFLEDECIFDAQRLPSYTALPIIAALWNHRPTQPDKLGNANILFRKFLWRAFLTSRYEQTSTSNALQDYRGLVKVLSENATSDVVPIFNNESYPIPTRETILKAGWPKSKNILGRGLLSLQLKCGAEDIADGARATVGTITSKDRPREYHHLFPDSLLRDAGIPRESIFLALNCALLTWRTNRAISAKEPVKYLRERADNCVLGEYEVKRRLRSHLIPYAQLAVGFADVPESDLKARVKADYEAFLLARAEILAKAASLVCDGKPLELNDLMVDAG